MLLSGNKRLIVEVYCIFTSEVARLLKNPLVPPPVFTLCAIKSYLREVRPMMTLFFYFGGDSVWSHLILAW